MSGSAAEESLRRVGLPHADALRSLSAALGPISVVDLETTGLEPLQSRVIEVGVVRVRGGCVDTFHSLIDPGIPVPPAIRQLTGIAEANLQGRPCWEDLHPRLRNFLAGTSIVAHNASFERAFLAGLVGLRGHVFLDTLELACVLRSELESHSLASLTSLLFGRDERHRALDDALDTLAVLAVLHEEIRAGEHSAPARLLRELGGAWSWAPLFDSVPTSKAPQATPLGHDANESAPLDGECSEDGRRGEARSRIGIQAHGWSREPSGSSRHGPSAPAHASSHRTALLAATPKCVRDILTDEARWRSVAPGYRVREEQVELAAALASAFCEGRAVAAEAGAGVGKTLAYTLVAVLHSLNSKERVVISSANRTLQERVVREELPRVCAVLGVEPPAALVLKGRLNYGNPRRARLLSERPEALGCEGLSTTARLYTASFFERCGDRDLQSFGGWLLHNDAGVREIRDRISCQPDCDERACRREPGGPCAYLQHLDALERASVVSINHSLLLRWPARYGAIPRLIVDEAHELAGEADRAFSEEVRSAEIRTWLNRLVGRRGGGLIGVLGLERGDLASAGRLLGLAHRAGQAMEDVGRLLRTAAGEHAATIPAPAACAGSEAWRAAADGVGRFGACLAELGEALGVLAAGRREEGAESAGGVEAEAAGLALSLVGAARGLLEDAFVQSREDAVYAARAWLRRDQTHDWLLRATPLETAERIHARVLEPARTVVALSATLGIGGDPAPTLEKMGWFLLDPERRMPTQVVRSPFDYGRKSVLAFLHEGSYRDERFNDRCVRAVVEVARLLGGRTMMLFTNANRLEKVADRAERELAADGIATLLQHRGAPAARLVAQFHADPRAVLLGTRSLWQGVDIPGDALSAVLIDKLPFPPPDDPLTRGRALRIRGQGGDEFRALSLEPAVVAFKQMVGRLIRTESDRGFVVVLGTDPRKSYLDDFVRSLPGPPRVRIGSLAEVLDDMRDFFTLSSSPLRELGQGSEKKASERRGVASFRSG